MKLVDSLTDGEAQRFEQKGRFSLVGAAVFVAGCALFCINPVFAGETSTVTDGRQTEQWVVHGERGSGTVEAVDPKTGQKRVFQWSGNQLVNPDSGEITTILDFDDRLVIGGKVYGRIGGKGRFVPLTPDEIKSANIEARAQRAIAEYKPLILKDPFNDRLHTELRRYLTEIKGTKYGIRFYDRLSGSNFTSDPMERERIDAHLLYLRGRLYLAHNNPSKAADRFRWAIKDCPENAEYHFQLGRSLYIPVSRGNNYMWSDTSTNLDAARTSFERVLELESDSFQARFFIAKIAIRKGDYQRAETELSQIPENERGTADFHNTFGYLLQATGRNDKAIQEYKKALELDPDFAPARTNISNARQNKMTKSDYI